MREENMCRCVKRGGSGGKNWRFGSLTVARNGCRKTNQSTSALESKRDGRREEDWDSGAQLVQRSFSEDSACP